MSKNAITVTDHLLTQQINHITASNNFLRLLNELIFSAKIISREINKASLTGMLGSTNNYNIQGENIYKLDQFAHDTIVYRIKQSRLCCVIGSEEAVDPIEMPNYNEKYIVLFDPLDGSSNIDANMPTGTIFSILYKQSNNLNYQINDILQSGIQQIASGYFLYGSSTMMIYTIGNGVNGFILDPSLGEFFLTHPNIKIPYTKKIFSANIGNWEYWDEDTQAYLNHIRKPSSKNSLYSYRYIGSLVADFHRTLLYGGIFLYPKDNKNINNPHGKLRLLYECNPLAFIVEQANGLASTGKERVMDIVPKMLHQRIPFIIGSPKEISLAEEFYSGYYK